MFVDHRPGENFGGDDDEDNESYAVVSEGSEETHHDNDCQTNSV